MTTFDQIGGKEAIDRIVDEFYRVMSTDPKAKECLATHPGDLGHAALKLKAFLSGWLGGPQEYVEKFGHPRMRMRHMPFSIGELETIQWLYCMRIALDRCEVPEDLANQLMRAFKNMTDLVRNRD